MNFPHLLASSGLVTGIPDSISASTSFGISQSIIGSPVLSLGSKDKSGYAAGAGFKYNSHARMIGYLNGLQ